MVCDVCRLVDSFDPDVTDEQNLLVTCTQCKIKVHEKCYGITKLADPWMCSFCESGEKENEKKCALCFKAGGALKKTTKSAWVHIICSLFTPKVLILDNEEMQPICLDAIRRNSFELLCYICEEIGACVKCSTKSCKKRFHVTCAQEKRLLVEQTTNEGESIDFNGYCEEHVSGQKCFKIISKNVNHVMNARRRQSFLDNANKKNADWIFDEVSKMV